MTAISTTEVQYVRCVKPNRLKSAKVNTGANDSACATPAAAKGYLEV
jgi:hypothetical protein